MEERNREEKKPDIRGGLSRLGPKTREALIQQKTQLQERIAKIDRTIELLDAQRELMELAGNLDQLF